MRRTIGTLTIGLAALTAGSCEAITGVAPEGTPRVEVELTVLVHDVFLDTLAGVDADSELVGAVKDAVRSEADLGLRFYPTPSEAYGPNDQLPDYRMTVELTDLALEFDHDRVGEEGEETEVIVRVDRLRCSAKARLERRRPSGPTLLVASTTAVESLRAEDDPERLASDRGYSPRFEGGDIKVLERDILRVVRRAADEALEGMRTPIDREFAPLRPQE